MDRKKRCPYGVFDPACSTPLVPLGPIGKLPRSLRTASKQKLTAGSKGRVLQTLTQGVKARFARFSASYLNVAGAPHFLADSAGYGGGGDIAGTGDLCIDIANSAGHVHVARAYNIDVQGLN